MSTEQVANPVASAFTFFQGKNSPFSIEYESHFAVKDLLFNSVEQYLLYKKAKLFNYTELAREILQAQSPAEQRKIARMVRINDEYKWSRNSLNYIYEGSRHKFSKNPKLLDQLLATRGTTIVYTDAKDKEWGIGMSQHNEDINDKSKWLGKNQLGEIITQLREDLYSGLQTNKIVQQGLQEILRQLQQEGHLPEGTEALGQRLSDIFSELEFDALKGTDETLEVEFTPEKAPIYLILHHTTSYKTYQYPIGLRLMSMVDANRPTQMVDFWKDVAALEEAGVLNEQYAKLYFWALTDDRFYVDEQKEELSVYGTQKNKGKVTGQMVKPNGSDFVSLKGTYLTSLWKESPPFSHILFQISRLSW